MMLSVTSTVAFPASLNSSLMYDPTRAARLVAFSGISYCSGTLGRGVDSWDCCNCKRFPDVQAISFIAKGPNQNGFVAFDPHGDSNGNIIVSFAGTDPLSISNWIDDLDTVSVPYPTCSGCMVHEGFYGNYNAVTMLEITWSAVYLACRVAYEPSFRTP